MTTEHPTTRSATAVSAPTRSTSPVIAAMVAGLVLTVLAATVPVVDRMTVDGLGTHLDAVYAGAGVPPPPASVIVTYLVVVGVLGALAWLLAIAAVRRGRPAARPLAATLFVVGTAPAVLDLAVSEYGAPILPVGLGLVGLLPSAAGLVAVVGLYRRSARRRVV
jgi:hypothetical protein